MNQKECIFINTVWEFYRTYGRHDLPWRHTHDPYEILVSEIMLQQTQVERVLPKYKEFLKQWPTARRLAAAPLSDVLTLWQGLGYNRRAKLLHQCVRAVVNDSNGRWPQEYNELKKLPGIGPYTAGAVLAFAFNHAEPIIETNIRTVYLHHFFKHKADISETELLMKIAKTLDTNNPREWYYALMDYGTHLKRTIGNNAHNAKSYKKQSKFKGSDREIRGAVVRRLAQKTATLSQLEKLGFDKTRLRQQLGKLEAEGLIQKQRNGYALAT